MIETAFRNGLTPPEVEYRLGLAGLRHDRKYAAMLSRLHLDPKADPGGLTPRPATGCPEWGKPGMGLRQK
jgi:hypothetical protein